MKPLKLIGLLILLAAMGGGGYYLGTLSRHDHGGGATAQSGKPKVKYTCGMHPQIIQDEPGNCPICGMKRTPMRREPGAGGGSASAKPDGERKIKYWRAPMEPSYIYEEPGKSPMGMDLVPVYSDEVMEGAITIDPVTMQNKGIRMEPVRRQKLSRIIRTVGHLVYDEAKGCIVNTKR